jgi:hypothetical protein
MNSLWTLIWATLRLLFLVLLTIVAPFFLLTLLMLWLYLESSPVWTVGRYVIQFTQCLAPGKAGEPGADLKAKLIKAAVAAGWRSGLTYWEG